MRHILLAAMAVIAAFDNRIECSDKGVCAIEIAEDIIDSTQPTKTSLTTSFENSVAGSTTQILKEASTSTLYNSGITSSLSDKPSIPTLANSSKQQNIPLPQVISGMLVTEKSDRFNYASFDCGALILASNKEAKDATSILVKSKDQYMLNQCSAKDNFIIVELCQEILIDTIYLANYEYFSSNFKDFNIYVSAKYPPDNGNWIQLHQNFTAVNRRSLQV